MKKKLLTDTRLIALGYLAVILLGTALLSLPIANKAQPLSFTDNFMTATSATCVTGLVAADTFSQWTTFGQIVIAVLIQFGGLGFMTVSATLSMMLGKKLSLRSRDMLGESISSQQIGGVLQMAKRVVKGTFLIEGIGAVLIAWRLIPRLGWLRGIAYGVFHSISAFCNGGFDLMGINQPFSSLVTVQDDIILLVTFSLLILIGGIGFFVWDDIRANKLHFKRYKLHSKIALTVTLILTVVGTALIFAAENHNTLEGMPFGVKLANALFTSVTPRTAGFNSVDTGALLKSGKMIVMLLMMVGGSSGSTAGGMKTSTIAVICITAWARLRNKTGENICGRRLENSAAKKAAEVIAVYFALLLTGTLLLSFLEPQMGLTDIFFEAISATSTVGMTTGITQSLCIASRWVITILMYSGRVGSVSFALLFTEKKAPARIQFPEEKISIG